MGDTRARRLGVLLALTLLLSCVPVAGADDGRSADWFRTVRDTALWSGPNEPAVQFTTLPLGSFLQPKAGSDQGRLLVYFPGDGATRQAGLAWVAAQDVAPSGPPPWIAASELDGDHPVQLAVPGPKRVVPLAPPPVSAPELAVVDDDTGLLLYGRSAHARQAPASTTKIATALVVLQHAGSLDTPVRITVDGWAMAAADGSSIMGLSPGQRLSIRTLLYGLLLPSGNDAAEQLARTVAESRDQFVTWMNAAVSDDLHLQDTHFVNPSGLDAADHYSSAYDLAQLARRAMRDDVFREIVATPTIKTDGLVLSGHNPLIGEYRGADGVKTGTTDAAGRAIVGSATRNGHRLFVVVLHSDDLLADSSALFDWVWQSFAWT
ncbi:MAG TPA: D-alanyl-D-alanine carboxypeptidase family protein [Chloroflexota bacterium]|nr:D-alanyl-D-alanine carboxypeptidase family protein [Chloroflexota bacterium]